MGTLRQQSHTFWVARHLKVGNHAENTPPGPLIRDGAAFEWLSLLCSSDRWRLPTAVNDRGRCFFRPVKPQHGNELRLWRRQPVCFLRVARRFGLQIQVNRTVSVGHELVSRTQGVAVERVGHEEVRRVVHGQRPESVRRWHLALIEVQDVFVGGRVEIFSVGILLAGG